MKDFNACLILLLLINCLWCLKRNEALKLTKNFVYNISNNTMNTSNLFCKNHCNLNGYCFEGKCYCKPNFSGDDCSIPRSDCLTCINGDCIDGECVCKEGFSGLDCSISNKYLQR